MTTLFLLGADDPEMQAIKQLLIDAGYSWQYARMGPKRVTPANAYRADPVPNLNRYDTLVRIECKPITIPTGVKVIVIDHHRPGDPGYELGPEHYWRASSLGQLHRLLGLAPSRRSRVIAAMDHCFSAAIRGECPGVSVKEVLELKVTEVARNHEATAAEVRDLTYEILDQLKAAPPLRIGPQTVLDLREHHLGTGYSLDLLAAQIATAMGGFVALLRHRDPTESSDKITLTGDAQPATVEAFVQDWAPAQGLVRVHGAKNRGYAAAYTP